MIELEKKAPLRGKHSSGEPVFYWFLDDPMVDGELTSDNVLIDKACQLPKEIFSLLPIDNLAGDLCCLYWSKEDAFLALSLAQERFLEKSRSSI